nr:hypothetical protein [Tanacetum cinerariifolium]
MSDHGLSERSLCVILSWHRGSRSAQGERACQ